MDGFLKRFVKGMVSILISIFHKEGIFFLCVNYKHMRPCVVFIFRRDLRLDDNVSLKRAVEFAKERKCGVVLCFEFHDDQVRGDYFGNNAFQFMIESLEDLQKSTGGKVGFHHTAKDGVGVVEKLADRYDIKMVFSNKDYTPYATYRDSLLVGTCAELSIPCTLSEDYTLHPMNSVCPKGKAAYTRFTPYYNASRKLSVHKATSWNDSDNDLFMRTASLTSSLEKYKAPSIKTLSGGRTIALEAMRKVDLKNYSKSRNIPIRNATSKMSAYLKFGCISIREFYWHIVTHADASHEMVKQLYWKEFYANIAFTFPKVLKAMTPQSTRNQPFNSKELPWKSKGFERWCKGETGFPIVDAGMREMNHTGFMHNRLRMIVASFLIKDLHIDWRMGERYFAIKLTDYDPASNNGGWQWSAGTGTDAQPYHRIFNPWTQAERFDPKCEYIVRWIPELASVDVDDILTWDTSFRKHAEVDYPKPMVDHSVERKRSLAMVYKSVNKK